MNISKWLRSVDGRLTELERRPISASGKAAVRSLARAAARFIPTPGEPSPQFAKWYTSGGDLLAYQQPSPYAIMLALLTAEPPHAAGEWDISGMEVSGPGYARQRSKDEDKTVSWIPVESYNQSYLMLFGPNTGAVPWEVVGVARLRDDVTVQPWSISRLEAPVTVPVGHVLGILGSQIPYLTATGIVIK